jgi:hypothetical protein
MTFISACEKFLQREAADWNETELARSRSIHKKVRPYDTYEFKSDYVCYSSVKIIFYSSYVRVRRKSV